MERSSSRDGADADLLHGLDDRLASLAMDGSTETVLAGGDSVRGAWSKVVDGGWLGLALGDQPGALAPLERLVRATELVGAHRLAGPWESCVTLAIPALARAGPAHAHELEAVLDGRSTVAAIPPDGGTPGEPRWSGVRLEGQRRSRQRLVGHVHGVVAAASADAIVVRAHRSDGSIATLLVSTTAPGVLVHPEPVHDPLRPAGSVTFSTWVQAADVLATSATDGPAIDTARYLVALNGLAIGGAAEAIRRTVEYVGERRQFGVPVGSFQAVKHRLADAHASVELARALTYEICDRLDRGEVDVSDLVASRLAAGCAYSDAVAACIQSQGGMGFTWDQGLHLWYRQAIMMVDHPWPRRIQRRIIWEQFQTTESA